MRLFQLLVASFAIQLLTGCGLLDGKFALRDQDASLLQSSIDPQLQYAVTEETEIVFLQRFRATFLEQFQKLSQYGPYRKITQRDRLSRWMEGVKATPVSGDPFAFNIEYRTGQQAKSSARQSFFTTVNAQYRFKLTYSDRKHSPIPNSLVTIQVIPTSPLIVKKDIGPDWIQLDPLDTLDQLAADIEKTIHKISPKIRHKETVWVLAYSSNSKKEILERFNHAGKRSDTNSGYRYHLMNKQLRYPVHLRFINQPSGFSNVLYSFPVNSTLYPNGNSQHDHQLEKRLQGSIENLIGGVVSHANREVVKPLVRKQW